MKIFKFRPLRLIGVLLVVAYCVNSANAYRIFRNPDNHKYFGVRLSYIKVTPDLYIWEKPTDIEKHYELFSSGNGVGIGGIFHLPIVANLYFEPGLDINFEKFNIKPDAFIGENKELIQNGGVLKQHSVMYTTLKVPLMLGYHLDFFKDFNLSLFMGPGLNWGLGMDARIKIEKDGELHKTNTSLFKPYKSQDDDYLERFEFRWIMGASINYKQFMIGFKYDLASTGIFKTSDYNSEFYSGGFDITEFYFTIGYNFK